MRKVSLGNIHSRCAVSTCVCTPWAYTVRSGLVGEVGSRLPEACAAQAQFQQRTLSIQRNESAV